MNSNSVDLIATDPPFNKNKDFHATPDSLASGASFQDRWRWEEDVDQEWVDQIKDDHPNVMLTIENARSAHSDGLGAFLCFMAVRLLAMRRLLKPTGSIYLHCDPTASHYLKMLMDGIFGKKNFRNEIVCRRTSNKKGTRKLASVHDIILFYAASTKSKFNTVYDEYDPEYIKKFYRLSDEHGIFQAIDLTAPGTRNGASGKPWRGIDPTIKGRHWALPGTFPEHIEIPKDWNKTTTNDGLDYLDKVGLIYWPKTDKGMPRFKRYLSIGKGVAMTDLILDTPALSAHSNERKGYPTQKPVELYERIIKTGSNEGDIVLDPFVGCATTAVAAERLGREWVGIDIWDKAHKYVVERLTDEVGLFGKVHYTKELPERTDKREIASAHLQVKVRQEREKNPHTHAQMRETLLAKGGMTCLGCDREFDDPRYLELDHRAPASEGGSHHLFNRILLCGPCNKAKRDWYTLNGLRASNKREKRMKPL